jgi:uncharacterized protein (TIGR02300 family)
MAKPELGTKRCCISCAAKFFDLNKDPIVCPKCTAVFAPPRPDPIRSQRLPDRRPWSPQKVTVPKEPEEIASLEGTNAETNSPTPEAEEVDGDVLLLDDQEGELDTTEVIDADIEKDDT